MFLKPFVQDYVPAVGEVDAFLKVPRPDGKRESLGLDRLDEPCLNQSKRSYLDLLIKQFYKGKRKKHSTRIHKIENAHKKSKEVLGWINNVEDLQKKKQAPSVFYSRKMPEIDTLMQPFSPQIREALESHVGAGKSGSTLEFADSDVPLPVLTKSLCSLVGIPVYGQEPKAKKPLNEVKDFANRDQPGFDKRKDLIESLHVMFTLYNVFDTNKQLDNTQT